MNPDVRTWADGHGTWWASVPANIRNGSELARAAISDELAQRGTDMSRYNLAVTFDRTEGGRDFYQEWGSETPIVFDHSSCIGVDSFVTMGHTHEGVRGMWVFPSEAKGRDDASR